MTEIQRSFFGAELPGVAIAGDSIPFGVFGILLEVFFGRERTVFFEDLFGEHQVTMDVPVFLIKGGGFIVDGIAERMLIANAIIIHQLLDQCDVFFQRELFLQGKAEFTIGTAILATVQFCLLPELVGVFGPAWHIAVGRIDEIFFPVVKMGIAALSADILIVCLRVQFRSIAAFAVRDILEIEMSHSESSWASACQPRPFLMPARQKNTAQPSAP